MNKQLNDLLIAAREVMASWEKNMNGPKTTLPKEIETKKSWDGFEYWSPAAVMVESSAANKLRLALEAIDKQRAVGTTAGDIGEGDL